MKFPKILIALSLVLLFSCEKKDENEEAIQLLVGHWHIWDYEPSVDSPVEASLLAKEAILKLVEEGCDPIEFTFKIDRNVFYRNGMKYLEVSMSENGVNVSCKRKYDTESGTFDFDNEMLTLNYDSGTIEYNSTVESEYLTTQVDDMIINGVKVSGTLIFIRETGK